MSNINDRLEPEADIDINDFNSAHECEHIFHDGNNCMHVAGPGEHFCRWHQTAAQREERRIAYSSKRRNKKAIPDLDIPTIEDPESLQIAIHAVMDAIIDGRLTDRRAGWLLYSLQLSRSNVKRQLHFTKMRYSIFNLMNDLEEDQKLRREKQLAAQEKRANKKPPQSAKPADIKEVSMTS